ncbi:hypothetical protein DV735_g5390, partial [Chaetothyriales sp. CBS 134920]
MLSHSSPPQSSLFEWHSEYVPEARRTPYYGSPYSTKVASSPLRGRLFHQRLANGGNSHLPEQPLEHNVTSLRNTKLRDRERSTCAITNTTTPFAFERYARSSSAGARLGAHVRDNREKRKTEFMNGIRARRQEQKDDRLGDQILRMDYLRELKAWKQQKTMEEMVEQDEPGDEDIDMAEELEPNDEQEIEQLVSYLQDEHDHLSDHFSDDGYDQLFMELSGGPTEMDHDML